jgi:hypothetical protein
MSQNIAVAHKRHKNLWRHMKFFSIEHKYWTLFCNMHTSISDKIQLEIISMVHVCDVFIFYHIVLTDILDFMKSIWQLIHTRTLSYDMSVVDLKVNISQWKNMVYNNCIRIKHFWSDADSEPPLYNPLYRAHHTCKN